MSEVLGALECALRHVELSLRRLKLRLGVGVAVSEVGYPGDIQNRAVGSDLLRMGRRLQDCRLQSDLVLLVGSKRDSGGRPFHRAKARCGWAWSCPLVMALAEKFAGATVAIKMTEPPAGTRRPRRPQRTLGRIH